MISSEIKVKLLTFTTGWVGLVSQSNSPLPRPGHVIGLPNMGIFLRDPRPYLRKFQKKTRETPNGYVDERDRGMTQPPPVNQFVRKITQPLVGLYINLMQM